MAGGRKKVQPKFLLLCVLQPKRRNNNNKQQQQHASSSAAAFSSWISDYRFPSENNNRRVKLSISFTDLEKTCWPAGHRQLWM